MAISGQMTFDAWFAVAMGAAALLIRTVGAAATVKAHYLRRRRRGGSADVPCTAAQESESSHANSAIARSRSLFAEALIVRQRLSGHIDAATYHDRMTELARQTSRAGRSRHDAC